MSLDTVLHDRLIKKRNDRGLFLFSNGLLLLLGVLSSVSFSDLSQMTLSTSWIAIGVGVLLLLSGVCAFVYYHLQARRYASTPAP